MGILEKLQLLKETGSSAEKLISSYILATLPSAERLTSTQISRDVNTSQPSIVRFAQGMGYSGFTSFKYDLIKSLKTQKNHTLSVKPNNKNKFIDDIININNPALINTFFEIINSSRHVFFCHSREMSAFLTTIIEDYNDVGKPALKVEYCNASAVLDHCLTDCDSVIFLPGAQNITHTTLLDLVRDREAASLAVSLNQSDANLADVTLFIPQTMASALENASLKISLYTVFYHALQYCYLANPSAGK